MFLFQVWQDLKVASIVFSFLRADIVNYSVPLDLTKYLQNETEYLPWQRVIVAVTYLSDMLKDDKDLYPIFQVMQLMEVLTYSLQILQFITFKTGKIIIFKVAEAVIFMISALKEMHLEFYKILKVYFARGLI